MSCVVGDFVGRCIMGLKLKPGTTGATFGGLQVAMLRNWHLFYSFFLSLIPSLDPRRMRYTCQKYIT